MQSLETLRIIQASTKMHTTGIAAAAAAAAAAADVVVVVVVVAITVTVVTMQAPNCT